jgi:hypothetical protein
MKKLGVRCLPCSPFCAFRSETVIAHPAELGKTGNAPGAFPKKLLAGIAAEERRPC